MKEMKTSTLFKPISKPLFSWYLRGIRHWYLRTILKWIRSWGTTLMAGINYMHAWNEKGKKNLRVPQCVHMDFWFKCFISHFILSFLKTWTLSKNKSPHMQTPKSSGRWSRMCSGNSMCRQVLQWKSVSRTHMVEKQSQGKACSCPLNFTWHTHAHNK